jgi:diguanylate cyclase (GGDEF)-like protein
VLYGGLDNGATALWLSVVGACTAVFAGISRWRVETGRRNAFITAYELELRSAALTEANARLESNNRKLELRTAELARLNADLEESSAALETANKRLEELAGTDPLTGVANRRQLFEAIAREFGRARRYGSELALAVIDLDDFGPINKRHGVIAGDEVLAEFAAALRAQTRAVDLVARYGGEEFVVLMPGCAAGAAAQLLERVRASIAGVPLGSRRITLTFSAGVAELAADDTDPLNVVHRADAALRRAKAGGKNRVERS